MIFILSYSVLFAQKTDVIIMNNGDHITGEIKKLEYAILTFKTDDMGTLQIKWDKITHVISDKYFEVDLQDGRSFYGSLDTTDVLREIFIKGYSKQKVVFKKYVVAINPIKSSFWDILGGDVKVGFNYSKGSQTGQFNLGATGKYRTKKNYTELTLNSILSFQESKDPTRKQDLTLSSQLFLPGKWLAGGSVGMEQNTELGINLRSSISAGGGYVFLQSNHTYFFGLIGLTFNRESFTDTTTSTFNLEGVTNIQFQLFVYDHPKTSLTTLIKFFPGITDFGRIRANYELDFDWEIIYDLYWDMSFYFSYDNKATTTASSTDYGITTSFKYEL